MSGKVSGQIWFDDAGGQFSGATLHVKLEEVSRADASAQEIAHLIIPDCSHAPGDPPVDFTLSIGPFEGKGRYELRVHLDLSGNGAYKVGDQITTQSYPVLTQGYPDTVQVHLHLIK